MTGVEAGHDMVRARPRFVSGLRGVRGAAVQRVLRILVWAGVAAAAVLLSLPLLSVPFGYRTLLVTSGSMEPTAGPGDAIVLEHVAGPSVRASDVITFRPLGGGGLRTHRVMSIHHVEGAGLHFRTKGDKNDTFDPDLVPARNVVGRVVMVVPDVGRALALVASAAGRIVLIGVPVMLIVGRELRSLVGNRRSTLGRRLPTARRLGGPRRRTAAVGVTLFVALASGSPVAAIFGQSEPVGSNTISSGTVAAPVLTGLTPQLSPCRVNLSWTAPSGGIPPDGYDIYRATASGGPYTFRKHVGAVTSAADDSGPLAALTTYYYRLRSTRSGWTSVDSNVMSVTTLLCAL